MSKLKIGQKVPAFSGVDQDGTAVNSKELLGRKVVLYFYPKDDTPGCTAEACSLRDDHAALRKAGYEVIGVSPDGPAKHRKFIDKYDLPFRLLADPDKVIAKAFGVWGPKKFMGREFDGILRTTFLLDEQGRIQAIMDKVRTKDHADQILETLAELA